MKKLLLITLSFFLLDGTGFARNRVWESADGRSIEGQLLKWDDATITIRRKDGRVFTFPLSALSKKDQEHVARVISDANRVKGFEEGPYADAFGGEWVKFPADRHGLIFQLYGTRDLRRAREPVPLFVHLHGAGARAPDVEAGKVEIAAQRLVREEQYRETPCVVLVPTCPEERSWGQLVQPLEAIIDDLVSTLPIDRNRIYLSGYSMGARGVGSLLESRPDFYAAAMFADGDTNPKWAENVTTALWLWFSGERDMAKARQTAEAFKAAGKTAHFEAFPEWTHNQIHWKLAHDDEVFGWLFSQRRQDQ